MSEDSSEAAQSDVDLNSKARGLFRASKEHFKDLGPPWLVALVALAIFFVSQFVAVVLVSIGLAAFKPNTSIVELLDQSAPIQFIYVLVAEGLVVALTILVVKKWRGLSLKAIGLGRRPHLWDVARALGGIVTFYALVIISWLDTVLAFVALVILPPIGEETLMRGYLYSGLRARMRFFLAMIITSVLFGVAHLGTGSSSAPLWIAGLNTFLLSLVLVYLREKSGALYAPMLVHATNNLVAFTVHFK